MLLSIAQVPDIFDRVLTQITRPGMCQVILFGYTWMDKDIKAWGTRNIYEDLVLVSKELRRCALRWANPSGLTRLDKNNLMVRLFMENPRLMESDDSQESESSSQGSESEDLMETDSDSDQY